MAEASLSLTDKPHFRTAPAIALMSRTRAPAFGVCLGLFLAVAFALFASSDLRSTGFEAHQTWMRLLLFFAWLSCPCLFFGQGESFANGRHVALLFSPLSSFTAARVERAHAT